MFADVYDISDNIITSEYQNTAGHRFADLYDISDNIITSEYQNITGHRFADVYDISDNIITSEYQNIRISQDTGLQIFLDFDFVVNCFVACILCIHHVCHSIMFCYGGTLSFWWFP